MILEKNAVLYRHVFKNAIIPLIAGFPAAFIVFRDFEIIFASFLLGVLLVFVAIIKHEKLRFIAESKFGSR